MSWTDIFPVMDDDMVERYQNDATLQEKEALNQHFRIASIHNQRKVDHVVATSLFWKPASMGEVEYPQPTRAIMQNPRESGLSSRFENPWEHYVEPVFEAARHLATIRPDLVYRVYLANDLSFLIPDLVEAGCEVYLMASSSLYHNPGAMWRFLAMEEEGLVTMSDSDRALEMIHDIERTELVAEGGLCYWRCPYFWTTSECKDLGMPGGYHTASAGLMGSAKPLPMKLLCEAFIWCCQQGIITGHCQIGDKKVPILGSIWPSFGFDEFFTFFPRRRFPSAMPPYINFNARPVADFLTFITAAGVPAATT